MALHTPSTPALDPRVAPLLQTLTQADSPCWLLLDPALRPFDDGSALGAALAAHPVHALPARSGPDPRLMPCLVEVEPATAEGQALLLLSITEALHELAPATLAQGAGRRICIWLQGTAAAPELADHLSAQSVVPHPAGGRRLLRWYDPAVLWALWPRLQAEQQASLPGPLHTLHLLDPGGHWTALRPPPGATAPARLRLDAAQWQYAELITPFNRALRQHLPPTISAAALAALRTGLMGALQRAQALGFSAAHDLDAFAARALSTALDFDTHPLVARRLAARAPGARFTELIGDLGNSDWACVAAQCTPSPLKQQDHP